MMGSPLQKLLIQRHLERGSTRSLPSMSGPKLPRMNMPLMRPYHGERQPKVKPLATGFRLPRL